MKRLVVGLGNPGGKYENTRHNLGRVLVDRLIESGESRPEGVELAGSGWKPWKDTYMNELGRPLAEYMRKNGVAPENLLVVYDELDLPLGELQLRQGGSTAGHKGVASIISALGTPNFWRLRLGIGTPEQMRREIASELFVLRPFEEMEGGTVEELAAVATAQIQKWLRKENDPPA